jgi:NAD(P)-dependent dehydrogenase (short-subunit alcohol dehydrogenase family)
MSNKKTIKIALITGGSRGIGRATALSLAEKGIDVILTYKSKNEEAGKVVSEISGMGQKAFALQFDLADINSYERFIQQVSGILKSHFETDNFDYLINNAGIGETIPFAKVNEVQFDNFMNIHFKGVFFLTQRILSHMNDNGSIVNISSGTTRFTNPGYSLYASMKAAVEVFTRYLAKETGQRGIRANAVAPGPVETDFNNAAIRNAAPERRNMMIGNTALGRIGQADDIGSVIAFLCSEDAKWITGQRIEVSGGINL